MDNSRKIVVTNHYGLWNYMFADLEKNNGAVEQYPFTSYGKSSKEQLFFRICNNRLTKSFFQNQGLNIPFVCHYACGRQGLSMPPAAEKRLAEPL